MSIAIGEACPTCHHVRRVRKNVLSHAVAASALAAYGHFAEGEYFYAPDLEALPGVRDSHEFSILAYWDMIQEKPETRSDGGRAGWWMFTEHGEAFVMGDLRVPKYAEIDDGDFIGLSGPRVTIYQCLKKGFDLREVLGE